MSYFLNRATLRLHGGRKQTREVTKQAWVHFNRLFMAKKLAQAVGAIGYKFFRRRFKQFGPKGIEKRSDLGWHENIRRRLSFRENSAFIIGLEKSLRFLEDRGAVMISKGKIHYTNKEIDLKDEGKGKLDIIKTVANAIRNSLGSESWALTIDIETALERNFDKLFEEVETLERVFLRLPNRVKGFFFNPFLHLEALDATAGRLLKRQSERGTGNVRQRIRRRHPQTVETIQSLEGAIKKARELKMSAIRRDFDPRFCEPFHLPVFPAREVTLAPSEYNKSKVAFVISDVHLSLDPHPRSDDLLRFYRFVRDQQAPVVHNGDYYDLFVWRARFHKIQAANHLIMNAVDRIPIVIQNYGNHDGALEAIARRREKIAHNIYVPPTGTYFDGRVYIEHGHQADRHNVKGTKRGQIIVKVLTYLERRTLIKALWPNFMRWMELLERLWFSLKSKFTGRDEWSSYKLDAVLDRIKVVFNQCEEGRKKKGSSPFSEEDPLIYIRGHDHGAGFFFTTNELVRRVYDDPGLAGRVRYFSSGSWKGEDADFLAIDYGQKNRIYVYPFVWKSTYEHFVAFNEQISGQR